METTDKEMQLTKDKAMIDESKTKKALTKLKTIQDAIKEQTDLANKLTLKQVTLLPKNKRLGEEYIY